MASRLAELLEDPQSAFEAAAARTQQGVRPDGGRRAGALSAAIEGVLPNAATGFVDLMDKAKREATSAALGGDYNPQPVMELATGMIGAPVAGIPRGALGSGAVRPPLPMDEASRMGRAQKLGFDTNERLYRGQPATDKLAQTGEFSPDYIGGKHHSAGAAWFTDNPAVAEQYIPGGGAFEKFKEGSGIVPAYTKANQLDVTAENMGPEGAKALSRVYKRIGKDWGFTSEQEFIDVVTSGRVWEHGASLQFQNSVLMELADIGKGRPVRLSDNTFGTPNTSVVVFRPEDIRSPWAAFDPANKKSGFVLGSGFNDPKGAALAAALENEQN